VGGGGLGQRQVRGRSRKAGAGGRRGAAPQDAEDTLDRAPLVRRRKGQQRLGQLADGRPAGVRGFLQAALDDRLQPGGNVGDQGRQRRERLDGDLDGEGGEGLGAEGAETPQELVEHDAQRPDVRARVDLARLADLLRGHVRRRAEGRVGGGQILTCFPGGKHLGDPKVEDLDQR
jgi:hypothetical protein